MLRTFPTENRIGSDGHTRRFLSKIECAKCPAVQYYQKAKEAGRHVVQEHFTRQGWLIGNGPRHDICPSCHRKPAKHKEKERTPLRVVSDNQLPTSGVAAAVVTAEKPREMSRDDRRLIFSKLEDVFISEKEGYNRPWTDHAVAIDLGVPVAWVAKIRDENFGPAGSNEDIDRFLASLEAHSKAVAAIAADMVELTKRNDRLVQQGRELETAAGKILRSVGKA